VRRRYLVKPLNPAGNMECGTWADVRAASDEILRGRMRLEPALDNRQARSGGALNGERGIGCPSTNPIAQRTANA